MLQRLRELRTRHHDPTQLNLTPLIDVLFNLLIFVLASASIAAVGELSIDLPSSSATEEQVPQHVKVSIGADLALSVDGAPATFDSIEEAVRGPLQGLPSRSVVVHADRSVPTGVLVDLYDAVARAGAEKIALAAEPAR
jgi:biopolymer transport protein ExbD